MKTPCTLRLNELRVSGSGEGVYQRVLSPCLLMAIALCAFAAAPVFGQGYGHGTSEAVMTSPDSIVAAIDSKEVDRNYLSDGTAVVEDHVACKIRLTGPYHVLVAGISRSSDGFDVLREAGHLYHDGDSLDQYAANLESGLRDRLASILDGLRKADRAAFDASFRNQDALQLTLLGVERGHPRAVIVAFRASQNGSNPVAITPQRTGCPGDCEATGAIYLMGMHHEAENFIHTNPEAEGDTSTARVLQLIQLEYDSHPDVVGGPASVIRVTGSGAVMEQPGACTDLDLMPRLEAELSKAIKAVDDVVVREDIAQYSQRGKDLRSAELHASVQVKAGEEEYAWTGETGDRDSHPRLPEPWCSGELATMLRATLLAMSRGQGNISVDTLANGEPALVVRFHATAAERYWQLVVGSRTYPVAFDATAWFSQSTGELKRIQWHAMDMQLPASAGITRIDWDETFAGNDIAGRLFLTPATATYRVSYSHKTDRTDWTETRFSDFRRYGSTEKVEFEAYAR